MEFTPNQTYTSYGKVDTVNTSDGIFNYQVTLKDDSQLNLKVTDQILRAFLIMDAVSSHAPLYPQCLSMVVEHKALNTCVSNEIK